MSSYPGFQTTPQYSQKHSGSHIFVTIVNEDDPTDILIGATSGLQPAENLEALAIEEAGDDGVNEIVQGRHDGALTAPAFWTPEWNDNLPTRQNFIGRRFIVFEKIGPSRPSANTVLNVYVGLTLNRISSPFQARGVRTVDIGGLFLTRYNGAEWAEIGGGGGAAAA